MKVRVKVRVSVTKPNSRIDRFSFVLLNLLPKNCSCLICFRAASVNTACGTQRSAVHHDLRTPFASGRDRRRRRQVLQLRPALLLSRTPLQLQHLGSDFRREARPEAVARRQPRLLWQRHPVVGLSAGHHWRRQNEVAHETPVAQKSAPVQEVPSANVQPVLSQTDRYNKTVGLTELFLE